MLLSLRFSFFFLIVSGAKLVAAEMSVPSNEAHKGRNVKKKNYIYISATTLSVNPV